MKICIIGHSKGLGKYLFDYFVQENIVIGFSRSNGYDLQNNIHSVLTLVKDCDLAIINAPSGESQILLLEELCLYVPKIIIMGSVASNYTNLLEKIIKHKIEYVCDRITMNPELANILLLKLGFLEATSPAKSFDSDITIKFKEILDLILFWLDHPLIYKVDYSIKLTPYTIGRLKNYDAKDDEKFKELVDEVFKYNGNPR